MGQTDQEYLRSETSRKLWYEKIRAKQLEFVAIQCPNDKCLFRYTEGSEIIDIVITLTTC